jgi:hypothetical protein
MSALTKRSTIYFDPALHNILKVQALESFAEDLENFEKRAAEPAISFEDLLKGLEADGKI